jgi:hypothetical protein
VPGGPFPLCNTRVQATNLNHTGSNTPLRPRQTARSWPLMQRKIQLLDEASPKGKLSLRSCHLPGLGTLPELCSLPLFALPQGDRQRACVEPAGRARAVLVDLGTGADGPVRSAAGPELRDRLLFPLRLAAASSDAKRTQRHRASWLARRRAVVAARMPCVLGFPIKLDLRRRRGSPPSRGCVLRIPLAPIAQLRPGLALNATGSAIAKLRPAPPCSAHSAGFQSRPIGGALRQSHRATRGAECARFCGRAAGSPASMPPSGAP